MDSSQATWPALLVMLIWMIVFGFRTPSVDTPHMTQLYDLMVRGHLFDTSMLLRYLGIAGELV